ncbi:MAG: T9SS type A sorting domain-containing protein [Sphingobacteriales bacterium]|nr:T9SS type A sorting domain-containing protein [Sphingobacteriales bacterium]MBI3720624.1 T9SS type A sorting domain-containing protein [Sphingobacteriales bacterium]
MKQILLLSYLLLPFIGFSQITTPVVKANFGVDADLRANYFNGAISAGNDDWFNNGTGGTGAFIIDTTGSAARVARYATDANYRLIPFAATMKYPQFSVVNNRLLYDAYFYRDYHGFDSTNYASGSSKNGMSPQNWNTSAVQNITDKNDILDMMMHIRRTGPNTTDSLWMFAGVSIENTTGDRYFDFELYQTDFAYNRSTLTFSGYGPDAGHTSWKFDAAGNVTQIGDIIFSADYGSSSLTALEARIWTDKANLLKTPVNFSWTGAFDGATAGAQYGYASIGPKNGGTFYTGMECANNTWAGSFSLIRENNSVVTNYTAGQFMEMSINLTKIGLDPLMALLGGNICGLPFKKVFVKSRSSTSFTSELKDFVSPFYFFNAPKATVQATVPKFCGASGSTDIFVTNPLSTSTYSWVTADGRIVGTTSGTTITADTTGTYVVKQQLLASCPTYATDTIIITADPICTTLGCDILGFNAVLNRGITQLNWEAVCRQQVNYFEIERSTDGINFTAINHLNGTNILNQTIRFSDVDNTSGLNAEFVYYRVKAVANNRVNPQYSKIVKINLSSILTANIRLTPNPVAGALLVNVNTASAGEVELRIFSGDGKLVKSYISTARKGANTFTITGFQNIPRGLYHAILTVDKQNYTQKIVVNN